MSVAQAVAVPRARAARRRIHLPRPTRVAVNIVLAIIAIFWLVPTIGLTHHLVPP